MKTVLVIIALVVLSATGLFAQVQEMTIPIPPLCVCQCPEIPACPEAPACTPTLTCADSVIQPQGLWEVSTNKRYCGEIVLGPGWVIINDETLLLNKVKKMVRVEACN